jgi:hypothetical protein
MEPVDRMLRARAAAEQLDTSGNLVPGAAIG